MSSVVEPLAERWKDGVADRFAPVLDRSPEGVALVDRGRVIYANPMFAALLDCGSLGDLVGQPLASLRPELDCGCSLRNAIAEPTCDGHSLCEFDRTGADGPPVRVEASCTPFPWEGRSLLLVNLRDVSERERRRTLHESISRLRAIFHSVPIGIVQCSEEGRVVESNPAIERLFGCTHERLQGMLLHDFFRQEDADRYLHVFRSTSGIQPQTYQADLRYASKDGTEGWIRLTASLVTDVYNEAPQLIAMVEDVSEYKRAERRVRDAQKMEVAGRLVGGVAHDFNNLLTGILLYCDLLSAGLKDDKMRSHAEQIRMAGEQGAALVQQLLAISRQQVVEPRILCINDKVLDTRNLLSRLIGENIELRTRLEPALGNVRMDPTQFQQILLNLVINARDAMPAGGCILVGTANSELDLPGNPVPADPVPAVVLTVIDHGCGMSAETRSHLFEPFFTTKSAGRGNGLGLATIHDIVQGAGGRIEVESELGIGTTFRVSLPRIEDSSKPSVPIFHYSPQSGHQTILVVEDNGTVRQAVWSILRECGYSVLEASTGPEALAVARAHDGPIDLLLVDLGLPGFSGRTVARRLRSKRPDLKCLYMSGYEPEAGSRNLYAEPVVVFQKPFTGAVLLQKVREILEAPLPALPKNVGDKIP